MRLLGDRDAGYVGRHAGGQTGGHHCHPAAGTPRARLGGHASGGAARTAGGRSGQRARDSAKKQQEGPRRSVGSTARTIDQPISVLRFWRGKAITPGSVLAGKAHKAGRPMSGLRPGARGRACARRNEAGNGLYSLLVTGRMRRCTLARLCCTFVARSFPRGLRNTYAVISTLCRMCSFFLFPVSVPCRYTTPVSRFALEAQS